MAISIRAGVAVLLCTLGCGYADILGTTASVRPDNALIVDIHVTTSDSAAKVAVTYQAAGVDPLVSRFNPVSTTGPTTITIGRLRASTKYTYSVRAIDNEGGLAGTADGSFTTGSLPGALASNTYTLTGRMTPPLMILPEVPSGFRGYVALDLHSSDAPQIVWYYSNAPSTASGVQQVDQGADIVRERHGNFLFADGGSGPPPVAADSFYREITPDGALLKESPADCGVTQPPSPAPAGWIWGQGNDVHELLDPGADGVPGTVILLWPAAQRLRIK